MDHARVQAVLAELAGHLRAGPSDAALAQVAARMAALAKDLRASQSAFRVASPGEELCHELGVDQFTGIALYIVSDGPGTGSPPHEHCIWAVIAGAGGIERNRLFRRVAGEPRRAVATRNVDIGAGDTLILPADAIHATEVVGSGATWHLHLYGQPLSALAPLGSRTFAVAPGRTRRVSTSR